MNKETVIRNTQNDNIDAEIIRKLSEPTEHIVEGLEREENKFQKLSFMK